MRWQRNVAAKENLVGRGCGGGGCVGGKVRLFARGVEVLPSLHQSCLMEELPEFECRSEGRASVSVEP